MANGENFVRLRGEITKPNTKIVGDNSKVFNGVLAIPANYPDTGSQYIKISSFRCADGLSELQEGTFVEIHGHIEERSYDGKCRHCGGFDKKYWTEVSVDYFKIIY
jgi:hypothetical protein